MKHALKTKVVENTACGGQWGRVVIEAPRIAAIAQPGMFVQVRAWESVSPLLRRPFSIAGVEDGNIVLLVKKRGTGTRIITSLKTGADIEITGPLGNAFSAPPANRPVLLVAGGVGVAPLRFFIEKYPGADCTLFYGARDSSELSVLEDELLKEKRVVITTEDGSTGIRGLVTGPLEEEIEAAGDAVVLTCGPVPMMKAVAELAARNKNICEVSMETYMACGMGACMGCVVPAAGDASEYLHACTDGPVMDATAVDWNRI